jgi:hypothetical protein
VVAAECDRPGIAGCMGAVDKVSSTPASWLNADEGFFATLTKQRL